MPPIEQAVVEAVLRIAAAGAVAGLLGGLVASRRASLIGSILMGAIGGIAIGAIFRIVNVDPIIDAGQGYSYVYGAIGGLVLAFAVSASNKG
jgi:ABC-type Mn2+/Zn2+ transport system permease subunit